MSDNVALVVIVLLVANAAANPLVYWPVPNVPQKVERGKRFTKKEKLHLFCHSLNMNTTKIYKKFINNTLKIIYTILTILFTKLNV